jgi:hypothetical protein
MKRRCPGKERSDRSKERGRCGSLASSVATFRHRPQRRFYTEKGSLQQVYATLSKERPMGANRDH